MEFIPGYLRDINLTSVTVRFLLAIICSGIIGLSRGKKQHAAGLRTHMLVCIGSACVMMINQYMVQYMGWSGDIGRMGAQVISGIGFLGAGTILVTGKKHIRGLTSAAGLWASACMGLAAGIGFYEAAAIMCLLMFIVISTLERFDDTFIKKSREVTVYIEYMSTLPISHIIKEVRDRGWHVSGIEQLSTKVDAVSSFVLTLQMQNKDVQSIETLSDINGVLFVERI